MIARAKTKTSRPRKAVKKVVKAAKAAAPAKATVRSTAKKAVKRVKQVKPVPAKKVASRAKKTAPPVKPKIEVAPKKKVVTKREVVPKKEVAPKREVVQVVAQALDDMKAVDVTVLDVRNRTDIADTLIVASGTSDRHVRSIAQRVVENAKKAGFRPMGVEGEREGEWILVDLQDLILHIMLPRVREFYRLENLWDVSVAHRETAVTAS